MRIAAVVTPTGRLVAVRLLHGTSVANARRTAPVPSGVRLVTVRADHVVIALWIQTVRTRDRIVVRAMIRFLNWLKGRRRPPGAIGHRAANEVRIRVSVIAAAVWVAIH